LHPTKIWAGYATARVPPVALTAKRSHWPTAWRHDYISRSVLVWPWRGTRKITKNWWEPWSVSI